MEDHPWFVGAMERDAANKKLADYPNCTFLVRCRVQVPNIINLFFFTVGKSKSVYWCPPTNLFRFTNSEEKKAYDIDGTRLTVLYGIVHEFEWG